MASRLSVTVSMAADKQRDAKADILRQPRGRICPAGENTRRCRFKQNVVKGKAVKYFHVISETRVDAEAYEEFYVLAK